MTGTGGAFMYIIRTFQNPIFGNQKRNSIGINSPYRIQTHFPKQNASRTGSTTNASASFGTTKATAREVITAVKAGTNEEESGTNARVNCENFWRNIFVWKKRARMVTNLRSNFRFVRKTRNST